MTSNNFTSPTSSASTSKAPVWHTPSRRTRIVLITLILLFGFIMRIWNIDGAPSGIYPNEAQNGYDAYIAQETGEYKWFYPDNNGREGLYINMIALSFKLFGVNILSFKLASILIGTLTILGIYLLAREVFWRWRNGIYLALFSALMVAASFWHVMFSRIGFRAILLPLVLVFSFWLLMRGLRLLKDKQSPMWVFIFSGLIFGLGLHTYIAFRIAPGALIVLFIALLFAHRFRFRELLRPALLFFVGALITAAPMFWTFHAHPEYLTSRSGSISIFAPENNDGDLLGTLGKTVGLSIAKFNFWGDQNWRHGYPPHPTLEPVIGIFFIIGLLTSILVAIQFFFATAWQYLLKLARFPTQKVSSVRPTWPSFHLLLLAWFVLLLAPEFLTTEGLPHALRSIGVLPVVYLFGALGIGTLWHAVDHHRIIFRELFVPILGLILIYSVTFSIIKYHVHWSAEPSVAAAFNRNLMLIAQDIATQPSQSEKVVIAGPLERLPIKLLNTETADIIILYDNEVTGFTPKHALVVVYMTDRRADLIAQFTEILGPLDIYEHVDHLGARYYTLTRQ